jgi:AcrR family transcriptional regulator
MRKLAQELGVEAMSLYNHVANKDEILDGIVELVANAIELPPDETDWQAAMRRRVISAHEALSRHPWAARLWMGGRTMGGARPRFANSVLRGLREAGFSDDLTYHGFHVLQSHVLGFALQERSFDFSKKKLEQMAARFLREFPADEYPDLAEHVKQHLEPHDAHRGTFEFGLDLILDGLERLRDAPTAGGRPGSAGARRRAARPSPAPRP